MYSTGHRKMLLSPLSRRPSLPLYSESIELLAKAKQIIKSLFARYINDLCDSKENNLTKVIRKLAVKFLKRTAEFYEVF